MMEWQPIETAPKDGTSVLGYEDGAIAEIKWDEDCLQWYITRLSWKDETWWMEATHWMPLPGAPK